MFGFDTDDSSSILEVLDGSSLRIGVVHARWNPPIINSLINGIKESLGLCNVSQDQTIIVDVPGSYELPFAAKRLIEESKRKSEPLDALIAVGVLIKGETMHFEYISQAVSHGLMRVQMDLGVPIIFGVLTALTKDQALCRAGLPCEQPSVSKEKPHNHGLDWGLASVEMALKNRPQ